MAKKVGDIPKLREEILAAGSAKLASEKTGHKCRHPVITNVKHWPGSEKMSTGPFEHGHCKVCTAGKSVRPYVFEQL